MEQVNVVEYALDTIAEFEKCAEGLDKLITHEVSGQNNDLHSIICAFKISRLKHSRIHGFLS